MNNKSQEIKRFTEVIELRTIPGYSRYAASSIGFIKDIEENRFLNGVRAKTTKGYYYCLHLKPDSGEREVVYIHRLVALAFHELPADADKVRYEPNHKDGNKLNNCPDNLEWMTRSQNVLHAFDSGLCQVGVRVKAKNVKTGEVLYFNSLSATARAFEQPRAQMRFILANHRETPYDSQWLFEVDTSSDRKLKRHQAREVVVKDYVSNTVTIYRDSAEACDATGVKLLTINGRVSPYSKIQNKEDLIAGYVFRAIDNKSPWPEYSKEKAEQERIKYFTGNIGKPLKVVDLTTGEEQIYLSKKEFAKKMNVTDSALDRYLKNKLTFRNRYKLQFLD